MNKVLAKYEEILCKKSRKLYEKPVYGNSPITQKSVEESYFVLIRRLKQSLDVIYNMEVYNHAEEDRISLDKVEKIIAGMRWAIDSHEKMIKDVKRPEDVIL